MTDLWPALLRLLVSLPLVILLIYILLKLGLSKRHISGAGAMKIVDQLPMAAKTYLLVVKVQNTYLLLAVGDKGVKVLKEFDNYPEPTGDAGAFPPYLAKFMKKFSMGQLEREEHRHER